MGFILIAKIIKGDFPEGSNIDFTNYGIVFICYLKDGRYFVAHASPEIYNKLLGFSYE